MDQIQQLKGDLRFVRAAVDRGEYGRTPAAIYFLWAVLCLCGFALIDIAPAWVGRYWSVAGPAGFIVSAALGWHYARRDGGSSRATGRRHLLHWGGMLTAIVLAGLLPMTGDETSTAILLILALGYFLAGVHLDHAMLWVGLVMAGGYVAVLLISAYAWTMVGVALAIALTVAGLRGGNAHEPAAAAE
jgi:hypothetical protein